MKLVFKKDENQEIRVFYVHESKQFEFNYIEFIKILIKEKKLEHTDVLAGFSDAEIKSIKSMETFINKELTVQNETEIV